MIFSKWADFVKENGETNGLYHQLKVVNSFFEMIMIKNKSSESEKDLILPILNP